MKNRQSQYDIMDEIQERWSPRAFSSESISDEDVFALIEAASFAPSCFNEQPWKFIIIKEPLELQQMQSTLTESNQQWANKAPILILILANKIFRENGKDNYWHMFDAGTAWGYLSLEAQNRGLITHAMGGFSRDEASKLFALSDDYSILTVVAVGKYGNINDLTNDLKLREEPQSRKNIEQLIIK